MIKDKLKEEGADCCVNEIGEMIQNLVRTFKVFERDEVKSEGFTISQCYIMIYLLKNNALTMNQISEKMNLDRSTITRIIGNLVRDGYIQKNRSQEDGRIILASLTTQGREKAKALHNKVNNYYKQIIEQIPEGEVMQVVNSVNTLLKAVNKVRPNCCQI